MVDFKQIGSISLQIDSLKEVRICSAKKNTVAGYYISGMSLACMAFELSNIQISLIASSVVIALRGKHFLVNSEAIGIMLGCFLYLTIAFNVF